VAHSEAAPVPAQGLGAVLAPLALAQFICSFAGSNMNVMIKPISEDLDTTVKGVQTAITLFLLVMAALMIPGGKLTDKYGRTFCLTLGLTVYGAGALIASASPGLGVLILGYSLLQGIGTALLIPPVYILTTMYFTDVTSRARAFGRISAAGGIGAAIGPLLGGLIASAISWRAAFVFQALVVVVIVLLARRLHDPVPADRTRHFDVGGAVLSAAGLVLIVMGILAASINLWLTLGLVIAGALLLVWFFASVRRKERAGIEPLLSTKLFRSRVSNLGLVTQNLQWVMLLGTSFTVSTYLQVVRGYDPIQTGVVFTATTVGLLASSLPAERLATRWTQKTLIVSGFAITSVGIALLILMVSGNPSPWAFVPGLLVVGLGLGLMLTPSVNIVQGSFPDALQGDISGLSRSVSNLGSSLGTAVAGTILVAGLSRGGYGAAMLSLMVAGVLGLVFAGLLPKVASPRQAAVADAR
jgi:MFS family permease